MVTVHTPDPTPPGGLWLHADIPGQPLLNASPGSAPAQASLRDDKRVHPTARADDSGGGVKEVRIWLTYSRSKPGVTENAGLAGAPVAKDTSTSKIGEQTEVTRSVSYASGAPIDCCGFYSRDSGGIGEDVFRSFNPRRSSLGTAELSPSIGPGSHDAALEDQR